MPLGKPSVIVAGAGLAGLTAARHLERVGARVTVVDARPRVGGRVHTLRDGFDAGQHVEAGADLIEEEQHDVLDLAKELQLTPVRILRGGWGFYGTSTGARKAMVRSPNTFERAARLLEPEIRAYKAADSRWDSGIARAIGRQSVADWLSRVRADAALAGGVRGLRGFFLADADELSLLVLVDQFASGDTPGEGRMYRLKEGNDALPAAMARQLKGRLILDAVVRRVIQRGGKVRVTVESGRLEQLTADYAILTLPASTLRDVVFEPALPPEQHRAIRTLRYGQATRALLQFDRRFWRRLARPSAYGSDQPTGAVWDGNEHQGHRPGILTLLAGGSASRELRGIIRDGGWPAVVRRLAWLGRPSRLLAAAQYSWDADRWVRGGYAVFDSRFDPVLRAWLARPCSRLAFAGEHTSGRWQGYMNGAVESGRRAAFEIAMAAKINI